MSHFVLVTVQVLSSYVCLVAPTLDSAGQGLRSFQLEYMWEWAKPSSRSEQKLLCISLVLRESCDHVQPTFWPGRRWCTQWFRLKSHAIAQKCREGLAPPELNVWDRHLLFLAAWYWFTRPRVVVFRDSVCPMWKRTIGRLLMEVISWKWDLGSERAALYFMFYMFQFLVSRY